MRLVRVHAVFHCPRLGQPSLGQDRHVLALGAISLIEAERTKIKLLHLSNERLDCRPRPQRRTDFGSPSPHFLDLQVSWKTNVLVGIYVHKR